MPYPFYVSPQASGPDQYQANLIERIFEKLKQASAVCTLFPVRTTGAHVAGLIDDATGYFQILAVSIPRPDLVSGTAALRGPLTHQPGDPIEPEHELQDDKPNERVEPLPRWIADDGGGLAEKRSVKALMGDFPSDYRETLKEPLGYAKVPTGVKIGPNGYAMNAVGDCLSPVFNEGDTVLCDPDQLSVAGDFVAIWWKSSDRQPQIKRLVYALPPSGLWDSDVFDAMLVVEQLNPPKRLAAELSRVAAVHKVVGKTEVANG